VVRIWIQELILLGPRGGRAKEFVEVSRVHLVVSRRQVYAPEETVYLPAGTSRSEILTGSCLLGSFPATVRDG